MPTSCWHTAPERVIPGSILDELVNNDRVVGGIDTASTTAAADFYRHFVKGDVFETDVRTAEIVKLIENSYRDVNPPLSNELALFADTVGVDMREGDRSRESSPPRDFLRPGPGAVATVSLSRSVVFGRGLPRVFDNHFGISLHKRSHAP